DDQNYGTSFASAFATAAGAIVRDYFAQGFYPTATRQTLDRMPRVSGSLVRAALVASANVLNQVTIPSSQETTQNDKLLGNSRGANMGTVSGVPVGVMGNNSQGYGRPVLDQVLPITNYPPTRGIGSPDTIEYPAAGLIVYDMLGTGEPPINNTSPINCATGAGCVEKSFVVNSVNAVQLGGTRFIENGQLRIALSWPDPPSATLGTIANGGSGALVNDLDLEVESPGPDNNIATTGDNVVYDGNVYIFGQPIQIGQWAQSRQAADPAVHDTHNNIEAVHLTSLVNPFLPNGGNQIPTGTWKVRVRRGAGGFTAGQITGISGPNEDADGNGRITNGTCSNSPPVVFCVNNSQCGTGNTCVFPAGTALEDTDGDGLLDANGQPFSLVIAGPVLGTPGQTQTWNGSPHALPGSLARLDKYQYSCSDGVVATVLDPDATDATAVKNNSVFQVLSAT